MEAAAIFLHGFSKDLIFSLKITGRGQFTVNKSLCHGTFQLAARSFSFLPMKTDSLGSSSSSPRPVLPLSLPSPPLSHSSHFVLASKSYTWRIPEFTSHVISNKAWNDIQNARFCVVNDVYKYLNKYKEHLCTKVFNRGHSHTSEWEET